MGNSFNRLWLLFVVTIFTDLIVSYAQPLNNPFTFVIPSYDSVKSNWLPSNDFHVAGSKGFIKTDKDKFTLQDGTPIKFYGVTLVNTACFPDSSSAIVVAKRLRKLGVNLVKLWGWDYHNNAGTSIIASGTKSDTINANMFKLLDWFVFQLKQNGIYVHIVKNFNGPRRDDGVFGYDSVYNYGRDILFFNPQMQDLQRRSLTQFFNHINPYTKSRYSEEPAVAFITLFNVNTLYTSWADNRLNARANVISYNHSRLLDTMFNKYLISKYFNTNNLKDKYFEGVKTPSVNFVKNGSFESYTDNWVGNVLEGSIASVVALQGPEICPNEGNTSLRVVVRQVNANVNGITIRQTGFPIRQNGIYELSFKAKTDTAAGRRVTVTTNLGFSQNVNITNQWAEYKLTFRSVVSDSLNSTITFQCGGFRGDVFLDAISLKETGRDGLYQGEALENNTVQRAKLTDMPLLSIQRALDQTEFYDSLSSNYFKMIIGHAKNLGLKQLFTPTNYSHVSSDLRFQKDFDFSSSAGFYSVNQWDYTSVRTGMPNSDSTLVIRNYSLLKYRDQILPALAKNAIAGKPFVVENYNSIYPNKYRPEIMLFMTAYSSLQNWNALEYYYYSATNSEYTNRRRIFKDEYGGIISDPSMLVLMPQSAYIFRNGLVSPSIRTININHDERDLKYLPIIQSLRNNNYNIEGSLNNGVHLVSAVRVDSFNAKKHYNVSDYYFTNPTDDNIESDTKEIKLDITKGYMTLNTPRVQGFSGNLSLLSDVSTDFMKLNWISGGTNATILWTSLDTNALTQSVKSLLTVSTRANNTETKWFFGDSSISKYWGVAPTLMEGIKLGINFDTKADSVIIHPLDSFGLEIPNKQFSATRNTLGVWRASIDINSLGTPLFGIEQKIKDLVSVEQTSNEISVGNVIISNAQDEIKIKIMLNNSSIISANIYNNIGELITNKPSHYAVSGESYLDFNTNNFPSGNYIAVIKLGDKIFTKKFSLNK